MICDKCINREECSDYGEKLIRCKNFVSMTNEERIRLCTSTEELANILYEFVYYDIGDMHHPHRYFEPKKEFAKWLKQKRWRDGESE